MTSSPNHHMRNVSILSPSACPTVVDTTTDASPLSTLAFQKLIDLDMSMHSSSDSQESNSSNLWGDVMVGAFPVSSCSASSSPCSSTSKTVSSDIFDILNQAQDLLDTEDEDTIHVIEPTPIGNHGTVKIVDNVHVTEHSWHEDDTFMDVLNPLLPANVNAHKKRLFSSDEPLPLSTMFQSFHQQQRPHKMMKKATEESPASPSSANAIFPLPGNEIIVLNHVGNDKVSPAAPQSPLSAAACVSMENLVIQQQQQQGQDQRQQPSCLPTTATSNFSFKKELNLFAPSLSTGNLDISKSSSISPRSVAVAHSVSMDSFRIGAESNGTGSAIKASKSTKKNKDSRRSSKSSASSPTTGGGKHRNRFRSYQAEQWSDRFDELVEFRKLRGHCNVPHKFPENPLLAVWAKRQRYQYTLKCRGEHSTLTNERQTELEKLGFIWDSHRAAWEERFTELLRYLSQEGHVNVPANHPANPSLAIWVKCQRRQYKLFCQGEQSNMTQERIAKLESIGFIWNLRK